MRERRITGCLIGTVLAAAAVGGAIIVSRLRKMPLATKRVELLHVPVDPLTMAEAMARIEEFIRAGMPHHIFTADASGIERAQRDPDLLAIIRQADMVTADGAGVLLSSWLVGARLPERVSGVDLVEQTCALAARRGYLVYLFGAAEGVAEHAAQALKQRHPGLTVVGTRNGFFSPEDEPRIVQDIANARPDVLFVALGIPKQEQFIRRHLTELGVPVMVGVGGSFDVISGQLRRAPRWMQRTGLEWLYRVLQQPSRAPRLAALPRFILAAWRRRDAHPHAR